jgi:histidinol-phosphate aminotransferase
MSGPQPRAGLASIRRYVGGAAAAKGETGLVKLSSNESPFGPSPRALAAYDAARGAIGVYPDGSAAGLRAAIAARHGLEAGRLICGNGSDDILSLLAHAYLTADDEVVVTEPGFLIYEIAALSNDARVVKVPLADDRPDVDALLAAVSAKTRMVFIANPGNPTGTYLNADEIGRLHAGLPGTVMLVLDGAYAEYVTADDFEAGAALVRAHANVVMTRTFSKIYGLAGLRLGWAYGPESVIETLNRIRGPFNVNVAAEAAGIAALEDPAHEEMARAHNATWLGRVKETLARLGLGHTDSVANFVTIRFADADEAARALAHMRAAGYILRPLGNYNMPDCLRLTIGADDVMKGVIAALEDFVAKSRQ